MNEMPNFNEKNQVYMTNVEVCDVIPAIFEEEKVSIILENGFPLGSDTEDVFRGIYGDETFEENDEMMNAIHSGTETRQTLFLSNSKIETPFNERGMLKRILIEGYWTKLILHNRPLKDGMYAVIIKAE